MHDSITTGRVTDLLEQDAYVGICKLCGEEKDGVEPDAENYKCPSCGAQQVTGLETLLMDLVW